MPPLIAAVKDINIRVKYAAERAMRHLLDGGSPAAVNAYAAGADGESGRCVRVCVRVYVVVYG